MALQAPAWATLAAQMPALSAGLEAQDEGVWVDLGGGKRASVSGFKGGLGARLVRQLLACGWLPAALYRPNTCTASAAGLCIDRAVQPGSPGALPKGRRG